MVFADMPRHPAVEQQGSFPQCHRDSFIQALAEDFEKHGAAVIEKVRTDRPADYLKIISGLKTSTSMLDRSTNSPTTSSSRVWRR
jgi:hypothetical protein